MDISFVVVSWNALPWLELFLEGIRSNGFQTYGLLTDFPRADYEVILVDNASSDRSDEYCRSSAALPNCSAILLSENLGYARALNLGLAKARGDILVCCNSDLEVVRPDLIEWIQKGLKRTPKSLLGNDLVFGAKKGANGKHILYLQGHFVAFRREFLDDVGWWHEGFGLGGWEDVELSTRAQKLGYSLQADGGIPIFHHVARSTVYSDNPDFDQEEFDELQERNKRLFHGLMERGMERYGPPQA